MKGKVIKINGPNGIVEQKLHEYAKRVLEEERIPFTELCFDESIFDYYFPDGKDAMYEEAKKLVLRSRKCSTSMLQRELQIGYSRAAMLIDRMEEEGIVSPPDELHRREVLK